MLHRSTGLLCKVSKRVLSSNLRKVPFDGDEVLVADTPECSRVDDIGEVPHFDDKLITHLERLSLLRFPGEEAVANLREAVRVANRLKHVNVEGVEPLYCVWEEQECALHDDLPEDPLPLKTVLRNAKVTYEDYFQTPPGNVPLPAEKKLDLKLINQWDVLGQPTAPDPRRKRSKSSS